MTSRRVSILLVVALVMPMALGDQQPVKIPRIGFLSASSPTSFSRLVEACLKELYELGYREGQNIVVDYRWAEGKHERLSDLVAELISLSVDMIVAFGGIPAALATKQATSTIPIVFIGGTDPVGFGVVSNLTHPGGNITGVAGAGPEIPGKRLELIKEAFPGVNVVAILWNPTNPAHSRQLEVLKRVAEGLGMHLQPLEVREHPEVDHAFSTMTRVRAGALLVIADGMFSAQRTHIAELALKARLPTMYNGRLYVEAGGLMSYEGKDVDRYRRAAVYIDKILRGAKPGDLPAEHTMRLDLIINMKTAKALGLTLPSSLLFRADEGIQ